MTDRLQTPFDPAPNGCVLGVGCHLRMGAQVCSVCKRHQSAAAHGVPAAKPIAARDDAAAAVDHPDHYGGADDPYEAIKVIEAWRLGFNLGNAVKYICRAGRKGERAGDLRKAGWYIQREIGLLEAAADGSVAQSTTQE